MTVKKLKYDEHRRGRKAFRGRPVRRDGFEALGKSDIVDLSAGLINKMTCDELVRMIRVAELPDLFSPDLDEHLPFYDHAVLARLAHLAQRCCRNQLAGSLEKDVG